MTIVKQKTSARCPDCGEEIDFSQPEPTLGLKFGCPHCQTNLEVIGLDPLQLNWDDGFYFDDDFQLDEEW